MTTWDTKSIIISSVDSLVKKEVNFMRIKKGFTLAESVQMAKEYISQALSAMLDLGKGCGPMQHNFNLQGEYAKEAE